MGFETSGIMNHVIDANGIINTTFLFSCLGYVFLYFLIYLQKLFLSEINDMKVKTTRDAKSLLAKLPAGSVSSWKTTSQLDS